MNSALILALLSTMAYAAIQEEGYVVPTQREQRLGPVVRTGRYRVLQERIIGAENDYPQALQLGNQPFVQGEHPERPFIQGRQEAPANGQHFVYNGQDEGKAVYIYRRVHTPIRITNGVIERVGPAQTVERWAEGGYEGSHNHNVEVFSRVGQSVYADQSVPVKDAVNEFL